MAGSRGEQTPDPLGKRALFSVPSAPLVPDPESAGGPATGPSGSAPDDVQNGNSGAAQSPSVPDRDRDGDRRAAGAASPLVGQGAFTVVCARCRQSSRVGVLDLVIFQFPLGYWLPKGRYDHRMTCPSCRRRTWCSVTVRRG